MHTGSLGVVGAAAATPLAQRQTETDRLIRDDANHARQVAGEQAAQDAAGIGKTGQDEPVSDRDADGRRVWELSSGQKNDARDESVSSPPHATDPTGQSGTRLDLSG